MLTTSYQHIANMLTDVEATVLSQDDLTLPVGDAGGRVGSVPAWDFVISHYKPWEQGGR